MQAQAGSDVTLSTALQNQATQKVTDEHGYLPYVYESDKSTDANAGLTIAGDESTVVNVYFRLKTVKLYLADQMNRRKYPGPYTPQNYGPVPSDWIVLNPNDPIILRYGQTYDFTQDYPVVNEWRPFGIVIYYLNGVQVKSSFVIFINEYKNYCANSRLDNIPDGSPLYYVACDMSGDYEFWKNYYHETIASALTEDGYLSKSNYELYEPDNLRGRFLDTLTGAISNALEPFETLHNMTTGYSSYQETGGPYPNHYHYYAHFYKGQLYTEHQIIDEYGDSNVLKFYQRRCKYPLVLQKGVGPDPVQAELAGIPYEMNIADYLDWYETQNGVEGLRFTNNDGDPEVYEPGVSTYVRDEIPYLFVGWYDNEAYAGSTVDFADRTMPQGGLTVYAKWVPQQFEVTFDVNGGTWTDSAQTQQTVDYGSQVAEPSEPTPPTGAMFLGWTLNGKAYSFASPVTANITLVAHYASDEAYHVLYDAGEGSGTVTDSLNYLPDSTAVAKNSDGLTPPPGKRFDHWVDADGNAYLPGDLVNVVDADVTLTAIDVPDLPMTALVYDRNYSHFSISPAPTRPEEDVTSLPSAANNSKVDLRGITAAEIPAGWSFEGWFLDEACTQGPVTKVLIDHATRAANVVYAKWSQNTINIPVTKKWDDNGDRLGRRPASVTIHLLANGVDTGETLTLTAAGQWTGVFTDLPTHIDGVLIRYSITEDRVLGYQAPVITGSAATGFTVTNRLRHNPWSPQTGDHTPWLPWLGALLLSGLALAGDAVVRGRKRRYSGKHER